MTFAVVGAGLAGSMMALMLAKRGMSVELYEMRSDYRIEEREEAERNRYGTTDVAPLCLFVCADSCGWSGR